MPTLIASAPASASALAASARGDVAGHDLDAVRQGLHPLDRRSDVAVMAMGGVNDDAVDPGFDQRLRPFKSLVANCGSGSHAQAALGILGG